MIRFRLDRRQRPRFCPRLEILEDRCLPSVVINEFAIPTANSFPMGITAGPDGTFGLRNHLRIKSGRSARARTPSANSRPRGCRSLMTTGRLGMTGFANRETAAGAKRKQGCFAPGSFACTQSRNCQDVAVLRKAASRASRFSWASRAPLPLLRREG
jgi:hypothetical protein